MLDHAAIQQHEVLGVLFQDVKNCGLEGVLDVFLVKRIRFVQFPYHDMYLLWTHTGANYSPQFFDHALTCELPLQRHPGRLLLSARSALDASFANQIPFCSQTPPAVATEEPVQAFTESATSLQWEAGWTGDSGPTNRKC
mmetsp:Transcript_41099/g.64190  ORF Transcript_41099/g.64190 Transcript_41099/m.64190 type:complete len:140 (+) Transcript_41099:461-880(+)